MTAFHCTMCGACCTNLGADRLVLLLKDDIELIAAAKDTTANAVVDRYCEINHDLSARAGTRIVQLKSAKGRCIFLGAGNSCVVHDYKPTQCRIGPDRFLPEAMRQDYECMNGVEISKADDLTQEFFTRLMEN